LSGVKRVDASSGDSNCGVGGGVGKQTCENLFIMICKLVHISVTSHL